MTTATLEPTTGQLSRRLQLIVGLMVAIMLIFPILRVSDFSSQEIATSASYTEGTFLTQIVYLSTFAVAFLLCWYNGRWVTQLWRRHHLLLFCMFLWASASIIWSAYPIISLKRSIQLAGLILVASCLTLPQARPQLLTRVLSTGLGIVLILSFIAVLVMPHIAIDPLRNDGWRGILWHKNMLGMIACFSVLAWLYRTLSRDAPLRYALAFGLFTFFMLLMSRSTTALISCFVGCAVYLLLRRHYFTNARQSVIFILYLFSFLLIALLFFFTVNGHLPSLQDLLSPLLILLGKDPDLTGRTDIWRLVMLNFYKQPLLGTGFGAFWLGAGSPSQYIIDILHWLPLQAHNGYVDILNEFGIIGFGFFLLLLLGHSYNLVRLLRQDREQGALHWAFFIVIVLSNFSESQFFRGLAFQHCLFFFSLVLVPHLLSRPPNTSS